MYDNNVYFCIPGGGGIRDGEFLCCGCSYCGGVGCCDSCRGGSTLAGCAGEDPPLFVRDFIKSKIWHKIIDDLDF